MKALVFHIFGGPEVPEYGEVKDPVIGPDEILVKMKAIGLNFADTYRRKGNYHLAGEPPYVLGYEGAGIVVSKIDQQNIIPLMFFILYKLSGVILQCK